MSQDIYLLFSIDTEPDSSGETWNYRSPLSFRGVEQGIGEVINPLLEHYGAKATYLINNVVLEHCDVSIFKNLQNAELGTHLHPEFIDPDCWYYDASGQRGIHNQCFLPEDIEYAKMENITTLFENKIGSRPRSFRAGRWAARGNTIRALETLGYKVDSSVTPGIRWADATRIAPVDFRFAPRCPYHPSEENICRKGISPILEIPVSLAGYFPFRRQWLRPAWNGALSIVNVAEKILCRNKSAGKIVLNCMFHNVDAVAKLSPHCKDVDKQRFFLYELETLLQFAHKNAFKMLTLSEFADIWRTSP